MFSSQTILVPQGNKEADKWIVAKLYFQFLCWFFQTEQLSQDGAQVSEPYMAGGSRTTDSYNSTLYDFFAFNVKFLFGFIWWKKDELWKMQINIGNKKSPCMIKDKFTKENRQKDENERMADSWS